MWILLHLQHHKMFYASYNTMVSFKNERLCDVLSGLCLCVWYFSVRSGDKNVVRKQSVASADERNTQCTHYAIAHFSWVPLNHLYAHNDIPYNEPSIHLFGLVAVAAVAVFFFRFVAFVHFATLLSALFLPGRSVALRAKTATNAWWTQRMRATENHPA